MAKDNGALHRAVLPAARRVAGQLAYLTCALRVGETWAPRRAYLQRRSLPCWGSAG
jgi:hypothetical protein